MPITKKEFTRLLAKRMNTDETTAKEWIDGYTEALFDVFKTGEGVTIDGFGGFYVKERSSGTVFKFNPGQKLKYILGWSSTYKEKHK